MIVPPKVPTSPILALRLYIAIAVLPRLTSLLQGQMVREWMFGSNLSGPSLYLVNSGAGSLRPREGPRGYVPLFLVTFAIK